MAIKLAAILLGVVCVGAPIVQTLRFRRYGSRSPWRIPVAMSPEGLGWALVALSLGSLFTIGAWVVVASPWAVRAGILALPVGLRLIGAAVGLAGSAFSFWSQTAMGGSWRIGTDQDSERDLVTEGIYARVRNPIYLGLLLQIVGAAWLLPCAVSALAVAVGYTGLRLVVWSEERFLIGKFGQAYRDYMARTGRFLPRALGTAAAAEGK